MQILENIITNRSDKWQTVYEAKYYLSFLLLEEYLATKNEALWSHLDALTKEILEFGQREELTGFRIKANYIRILTIWVYQQHYTLNFQGSKVDQLLYEVQQIADKHGLNNVMKQSKEQYSKLLNQKQSLEEFILAYFEFN